MGEAPTVYDSKEMYKKYMGFIERNAENDLDIVTPFIDKTSAINLIAHLLKPGSSSSIHQLKQHVNDYLDGKQRAIRNIPRVDLYVRETEFNRLGGRLGKLLEDKLNCYLLPCFHCKWMAANDGKRKNVFLTSANLLTNHMHPTDCYNHDIVHMVNMPKAKYEKNMLDKLPVSITFVTLQLELMTL